MMINQDRSVDMSERLKRQDGAGGGMMAGQLSKKNSFTNLYDRLKNNYGYQTLQQPM